MALPPQKFREAVLQILFAGDFSADDGDEMVPFMMQELKTTRKAMKDAHAMVHSIRSHLNQIDPLISSASREYSFERISGVEKAILRLSIFEVLFEKKTPVPVAMAEAIRLCKKFATTESSRFVNALLDEVYNGLKSHEAHTPNEPSLI